jgi:regulator of sigma E protease
MISTNFLLQLFQFIVGIGIVIVLHELGHFLVARLFKVEVEEFGIGFPPRLAKLFEAGGTVFTLNWIPLGGFVRPKGENDPSIPGGLAASSPWVRLAVLFAGPAMNLLLGVLIAIILIYNRGEPDHVLITEVTPNSPAASAGLQPGDWIAEINGQEIHGEELQAIIQQNLGQPVELVYKRGDQNGVTTLTPRENPPENEGPIGIVMQIEYRPISWLQAIPQGASAAYEYARNVLMLPVRIFQGQASPQEGRLIGFKGMFDVYQQIPNPLWFFMAITMSLGLFNLFPIPALDGGRIVLTLPEIFLRRRIPPHYENLIHLVGFTVLIIFLIYINLQDFINPIQLP